MREPNNDICDEPNGQPSLWSTHIVEYEKTEPVSLAVIGAVSAVTGIAPVHLPPLAEAIETDALDGMFRYAVEGATSRALSFCYARCRVTVRGDGHLTVTFAD